MNSPDRILGIFYQAIRGTEISVRRLADEYEVSTKSISRDLSKLKSFLAENRELVGHTELIYSYSRKAYYLTSDEYLTARELFSIAKVILGSRAFSHIDVVELIAKFKKFTSSNDRKYLDKIVCNELHHFSEVKHDCDNVMDNLWKLALIIHEQKEVSICYSKMDRTISKKRIQPVSLIFTDYYFYLIAYYPGQYVQPRFFRVDRIIKIVEHRHKFDKSLIPNFNEGELRRTCQFMFSGKLQKIRFSFTGPSVQAILDRLPSAKIIERQQGGYIIEAETQGDGIKMFLLSQGSWVKVLHPPGFIDEMRTEISNMVKLYD